MLSVFLAKFSQRSLPLGTASIRIHNGSIEISSTSNGSYA